MKVDNINQNLIITPAINTVYKTKVKPYGARITFPDTAFKPNTTYSLNFRATFKDFSEGNEAKNIKLVFSTGPQIDSLKIAGKVKNLLANKPTFDALVGLYKYSDSLNIRKEKPYYFAKTDSSGNFNIENIQAGKYRIFAFEDLNNNTIFNEATEKIAFLKDTLNLIKNTENIELQIVSQDKQALKVSRTQSSVRYATVELNKALKQVKLNYTNGKNLPYSHVGKEIKLFNPLAETDTVKFDLQAIDSMNIEHKLSHKVLFKKATKKSDGAKDDFSFSIKPRANEPVENKTEFKINFSKPVSTIDFSKVQILADTIKALPISDSNATWNSYHNVLTIAIDSKAKNRYRLKILKDAIQSVDADTNKIYQQDNPLLLGDETGIIAGEITKAKGTEIVQLLNEKYEVVKELAYRKKFEFKFLPPGRYLLRMIQDDNKNGIWDSGDWEKGQYPEKIQYKGDFIQLKANFELGGFNFEAK